MNAVTEQPAQVTDIEQSDVPRRVRRVSPLHVEEALAVAAATAALVAAIRIVFDWNGIMSTFLWWYVLSLAGLWFASRIGRGAVAATDQVVTAFIWSVGAIAAGALVWLVTFVVVKGLPSLRPGFFTKDLATVGPRDAGGGAVHAIVGTLEQVGMAALVSVPLGILTAVYLHELRGRLATVIRFFVDAMSGLPSIIAGLLIYTAWVLHGHGFSGAAGAVALAILMLPTVTRTAEEILRTIPDTLREAALALGSPHWRVVMRIVLPTARAGLVTAAILAVARAVGETAPMLLTAFGSKSMNTNPFSGPQANLPLFVWELVRSGNTRQIGRAWSGTLTLVLTVLVLFIIARIVGNLGTQRRRSR